MNGMKKSILFPAIFVVAAMMLAVGCSPKKANPAATVPVLAAKSFTTNVPVRIDPPPVGHVTAFSSVTIRPQIGGILQQVHFKEGSEVKSNALLFTIDPRPSQAVLARDQAQLKNAEIEFAREQKLFDQKLISQDEFDTNRATRDTLAATVQSDELNLSFCEIRAPFDGVTGSLQFHEGNVVKAPDDTLLTINCIHPIYVVFSVPEQFLPEIQKQMRGKTLKVSVTYQNMTVSPPQGDLTFVDNSVDETTGTILLKATFPNEDDALWPGQFVQVELTLSELTDAVVVPSQGVQVGQSGQFVYVVNADQAVEMRTVKTGIAFNSETVIETGLKAGETVVTDGQLRLAPKVKVTVKSPDSASKTNAP
jgi:multidrug efflux system membrane fusion protein